MTADKAVCKQAEKMHGNIMVGDMVTTRLTKAAEGPTTPAGR